MKHNSINLKVFIGYQLDSRYHSSSHFESMGKHLNDLLKKQNSMVSLDIEYGLFPPGARLWDQIVDKIEAAHIAIFDISENNPNVLLEAGISLGTGKHVIFLKCEQAKTKYPTDIHNFIFLPYRSYRTLTEDSFLKSITQSIKFFLEHSHDPFFYHRLLWSLRPNMKTLIIPGILSEKYTGNQFEDYIHIRKYTDLDAVFSIFETVHRLYPRMDIYIHRASTVNELPKDWANSNIIFVGGPDFNHVVREFESLSPIEYIYGEGDEEVWLKHKTTGREFKPKFVGKAPNQKAQDYGFFLVQQPVNYAPAKLIFIGGARTWGVYGAAMLVSCTGYDKKSKGYVDAKLLVEQFGSNPSLLVPVEVHGTRDGIHPPKCLINDIESIGM